MTESWVGIPRRLKTLELHPHPNLKTPRRTHRCDFAKIRRRLHVRDARGILVIEQVKCSGREAYVRRILSFGWQNSEIVSPAQVEVHIRWSDLCIASHPVRAGVEEPVAVGISPV